MAMAQQRARLPQRITIKSVLKRLRKVERKASKELMCSVFSNFNATDGIALPSPATVSIKRMSNIAQGDNVLDREGNRIQPVRLDYRGVIQNTNASSQVVRFIAFYWNSDTAPTVGDIILSPAAGAGIPDGTLNNINEISVANGHLTIMRDKLYFPTANAGSNGNSTVVVRMKRKLRRYQYYNDTAGANVTKGYYYIIFSTAVGATFPTYQDGINFYFTD